MNSDKYLFKISLKKKRDGKKVKNKISQIQIQCAKSKKLDKLDFNRTEMAYHLYEAQRFKVRAEKNQNNQFRK